MPKNAAGPRGSRCVCAALRIHSAETGMRDRQKSRSMFAHIVAALMRSLVRETA